MSNGINVNGLDEVMDLFEELEITTSESKEILNKTCGNLTEKLKSYIKGNVYRFGGTLEGVRGKISTYQGDCSYKISIVNRDILYVHYGSRKVTEYIGFFDDFIDNNKDELVDDIEKELNNILSKKGV